MGEPVSVFPEGFDPRAEFVLKLNLALIDTPDGPVGFIIGTDGLFRDTTGREWWGSQLITVGDLEFSIGGSAPSGSITLSFFQLPGAPDLIAQIQALGPDYLDGREIVFYEQFFNDHAEFHAPVWPPVELIRRRLRGLTMTMEGAQQRTLSVTFESPFDRRKTARRKVYNTVGHAELIGAPNPSLEFIPRDNNRKEKLFG